MSFDLERLRATLFRDPASGHFVQEAGDEFTELTPAAVLFPIVQRAGGQWVLLTQRTAHLPDHAGQNSFPGGGPPVWVPPPLPVRAASGTFGLQPVLDPHAKVQ